MEILPFFSQYIFFLLLHMVNNNIYLQRTQKSITTTLYLLIFYYFTNLTKYQKGAYDTGIKIFNHLPSHINCVANEIQILKLALKWFLISKSFCFLSSVLVPINNIYCRLLCVNIIINFM